MKCWIWQNNLTLWQICKTSTQKVKEKECANLNNFVNEYSCKTKGKKTVHKYYTQVITYEVVSYGGMVKILIYYTCIYYTYIM